MEYVLKHGSITAVTDSFGAELISLKDSSGKEYIWQGNPNYWSGRNPHLFPIVGSLANETICFNGTPYHMSRHGFARKSEFSIVEKTADSIVFQLLESDLTLQIYPYPFTLRIRHQLSGNGFFTEFEIINSGCANLPFCIGGHTAFNCPLNVGEKFSDYALHFECTEDTWALTPDSAGCLSPQNRIYALKNTDTLPLEHEIYAKVDTLIFEDLNSTSVRLLGPDGHGVRMDYAQFPMIAFWTAGAKQAPYICLEPWHGCAAIEGESGEFIDKRNCIVLAPGERKQLRYTVTLI